MAQVNVQTASTSPGTPTAGYNSLYTSTIDKLPHWLDDSGLDLNINLGVRRVVPAGLTYTIQADVSVVVSGYYTVLGTLTIAAGGSLEVH